MNKLFRVFQNKLKGIQREKVKQFIALTQTGEATAIYCLTHNEWKLEVACDNYFQMPELTYFRELDRRKVDELFNTYKDPNDANKINSDGVMRFLDDMK